MVPVRWDFEDRVVFGALNFETDPWETLALTFECPDVSGNPRFETLNGSGDFVETQPKTLEVKGAEVTAEFPQGVAPLDFAVVLIHK